MSKAGRYPSVGFVAVCLTYLAAVALLLWSHTPPLDRVWTLYHLLKIGEIGQLQPDDRQLLSEALARHELLADALLKGPDVGLVSAHDGGWIATPRVTIIRKPSAGTGTEIVLDVQTPGDLLPLEVTAAGQGWQRKLTISEQGRAAITLPAPPAAPEIIDLTVAGGGGSVDPASLGLRILFTTP